MNHEPAAHRSYSQVNTLRKCGEQYRLEKVERVPQRPSAAAVGGTVFHTGTEVVDELILGGEADPKALAVAGVRASIDELWQRMPKLTEHYPTDEWKRYGRQTAEKPKAEDIGWFQNVGIPNAIQAYTTWRLDNITDYDIVEIDVVPERDGVRVVGPAIEVPFEIVVGGVPVKGFIDRVMVNRHTGVMFLLDLKSGAKPENDEQLAVYRQALLTQYGLDVQWGIYLYGLKTGNAKVTPPLDLSHWTLDMLEQVYSNSDKAIQQGIFIPKPGDQCFHCGVTDHCRYFRSAI